MVIVVHNQCFRVYFGALGRLFLSRWLPVFFAVFSHFFARLFFNVSLVRPRFMRGCMVYLLLMGLCAIWVQVTKE